MSEPAMRSPLKARPLRGPGQSVQDEIDKQSDMATDNAVFIVLVGMLWLTALLNYVLRMPPGTLLAIATLYLVGTLAWTLPRIVRAIRKMRHLKLGRDGERAVAEYLDILRGDGYIVFHDLVADGFNIDHILVGPSGVYTVETKTRSKPTSGDYRVVFDGESVRIGDYVPDRNPVTQAQAQARWLKRAIEELTGRIFTVRPVVAFPGWFVERTNRDHKTDTWVLEPKALRAFLAHQPDVLRKEDIALISSRLKLLLRGNQPT